MKIIIDAMGGDNAPLEIVRGAIQAHEQFGVDISLVGQGVRILECMRDMGVENLPKGVEIVDAPEILTAEDDMNAVVKTKKDSSMAVALRLLKEGAGDAMISAGSTAALMTGATIIVKRVQGIRRAAFAPVIPSKTGCFVLIDCGANLECTPEYLLQFAYMGSFYMKNNMNYPEPRVAILNIGTERSKGGELQKKGYDLLEAASLAGRINFVGNIEAREAMLGGAEVVVCDGFSGNVFLKSIEGAAIFFTGEIKKTFTKSLKSKVAGLLVKKNFAAFKNRFDYREAGGTAILGIAKPVIKAHGSSDARAIVSTVRQAIEFVRADVAGSIAANINDIRPDAAEL